MSMTLNNYKKQWAGEAQVTKLTPQRPVRRSLFVRHVAAGVAAALGVVAAFIPASRAAITGYTDFAAFQSDLSTAGLSANTLDFDGLTGGNSTTFGDLIASGDTVGGITFTYDFGGVTMEVRNDFDTTSPANYLGTDDGGVFQDGDNFDLSFAPANAVGMFFITADQMFDNDIELAAGGGSIGLSAAEGTSLSDGGQAFFLGLIDDMNTFSAASITTIGGGFFLYNVDDIVTAAVAVPEPASLPLMAFGIIGLLAAAHHRRRERGA
jgi:hypothetical protein